VFLGGCFLCSMPTYVTNRRVLRYYFIFLLLCKYLCIDLFYLDVLGRISFKMFQMSFVPNVINFLTIGFSFQKVTCTYDTNMCQAPCSICLCKRDNLSFMRLNNVIRTEESMKRIYQLMTDPAAPRNEVEAISKASSLHPIPVSFIQYY